MRTESITWQSESDMLPNYQAPDWTESQTEAEEAAEILSQIDHFGPCPWCGLTGRECSQLAGDACCGQGCRHEFKLSPRWW